MRTACVFGGGAWGTALAQHLATTAWRVRLVLREAEAELALRINATRENADFLPGIALAPTIEASCDAATAMEGVELLLFVVPTPYLRGFARAIHPFLPHDAPIVNCSKGIEIATLQTGSEILTEELPGKFHRQLAVLSGPNFAREVAQGYPANTTIAARDEATARRVQAMVSTSIFRAYTTTDVVGVETGGALKNVVAIAAGASDGLGLGANARAGLITRGLAEMTRLAAKRGADPLTLAGLSGVGDLVLTCTGELSRNRTLGFELGRGWPLADILAARNSVAEGLKTSKAVYELARRLDVDMPISTEVYRVLHEDKPVPDALVSLSSRPAGAEIRP